jgi:putative transposase
MAEHIKKSHNKTLLLYHLVFPSKYRRKVFGDAVEKSLKEICLNISCGYEIHFIEIGADEDHVHFLIQSVPTLKITDIVKKIKSITGRLIFKQHPEVKTMLYGGNFWSSGYYANTVGQYANEKTISEYVKNQGKEYKQFHRGQLTLFEGLV